MDVSELKAVNATAKQQLGREYLSFLNERFQECFLEIESMREQKNSGVPDKSAELAVVALLLALHDGADEKHLGSRLENLKQQFIPRKSGPGSFRIFKKEDLAAGEVVELMKF